MMFDAVAGDPAGERGRVLLAVVTAAGERLLRGTGPLPVADVLAMLGEALSASRVALIAARFADEETVPRMDVRHQWCAPGMPRLHPGPHGWYPYFGRWHMALRRGESITSRSRDLPDQERAAIEAAGVRTIALAPVFCDDGWYGHLSADDSQRERAWSPLEIETMRAVAHIIGGAIDRRRTTSSLERRVAVLDVATEATRTLPDASNPYTALDPLLESLRRATHTRAAWLCVAEMAGGRESLVVQAEATAPGAQATDREGLQATIASLLAPGGVEGDGGRSPGAGLGAPVGTDTILMDQPLAGRDAWERAAMDRPTLGSWIAVPVIADRSMDGTDGRLLVLGLDAERPRAWDEGEVEGLRIIAAAMACALRTPDGSTGR